QTLRRAAMHAVKVAAQRISDAYRYCRSALKLRARIVWGAIFLAGMATGSGLTLWLRPAPVEPAVIAAPAPTLDAARAAAPAPPEPEAAADATGASLSPAAADVPLPRPRPDPGAASKAEATTTP